jgi:hypothetical protein
VKRIAVSHPSQRVHSLDAVAARLASAGVSEPEAELLCDVWARGEDARLRDDPRFRPTPWGRWVAAGRELVNDRVYARLSAASDSALPLAAALTECPAGVFCAADPRLRVAGGVIRLRGAGEASAERDLDSPGGRASIRTRLRSALDDVLGAAAGADEPTTPSDAPPAARLVCLCAQEGGLQVETDPVGWLPQFVKRLRLVGPAGESSVLAANLRVHTWLTAVTPAAGRYRWVAPGFEEEVGPQLDELTVGGPRDDAVTVFRVDAAGVGRPMTGRTLTPGRLYRILVPPGCPPMPDGTAGVGAVGAGWRLWELAAPAATGADGDLLSAYGLDLGSPPPALAWVGCGPWGYLAGRAGEAVPVFPPGEPPVLSVATTRAVDPDELTAFLLSGDEIKALPLPPGREWLVALDGLAPGAHAVQVLHRSTEVPPEWEPFVVGGSPARLPPARLAVTLRGRQLAASADGSFRDDGDFSDLDAPDALEVAAPRCWAARLTWDDGRRLYAGTAYGQGDGTTDLARGLARTREARARALEGDLLIDCAELGRVLLRHSRARDPAAAGARLRDLLGAWAGTLAGLGDQFPLIRSTWLTPVLEVLGHEARDLGPEDLAALPAGATAVLLVGSLRRDGRVVRAPSVVLLLAAVGTEFTPGTLGALRAAADSLCHRCDCEAAFLTDGLRWLRHRRGYRATSRVWDVTEATRAGAEDQFAEFFETFGG